MHLLDVPLISGALILGLSIYTRHGGAISRHPYRNPEGGAPGASPEFPGSGSD